jgi:DegV family protein with EDD domain
MPNIQVITDTDSCLPVAMSEKYAIRQVPITIQFGESSYADGIEIDNKILFDKIDRLGKLPTTAAPSPAAFSTAFKAAFDSGADSIICITVGSAISRTYDSAHVAISEFPDRKITLIDSEFLTMGQGFMAVTAAEAVAAGATHEEAVAAAKSLIGRLHLYGSLSTLKYLALGGRVSTLAASMANMLNIRPILTMRNGKLDLLEKVRTHKAAMDRLVELIVKAVEGKTIERASIINVNNHADAALLESLLRVKLKLPEVVVLADFGPGLSVHTGSGMVGAVLLTKE